MANQLYFGLLPTVICLAFLSFSYSPVSSDFVDHWFALVLRCACVITESALIFNDLHHKYPTVMYEDSTYEPTDCQILTRILLNLLFYTLILLITFLSFVFLVNAGSVVGTLLFQAIHILILGLVVTLYLRDGFSDYSGDAFCEMLDRNNDQKAQRSLLPFSLPPEEMALYEHSFCLMKTE